MKLVLDEPEQRRLRYELDRWTALVSSALLRVEVLRACGRYGADSLARAEAGLGGVTLIPLDEPVLTTAARLEPPGLRSLDAIHLATALSLADDLGVVVTYDARLAEAAAVHGLQVEAPE